MTKQKNIILGVTASIAIYKACDILRSLKKDGFCVTVVMTPEAEKLMSRIVFQSLSANKVFCDMFESADNWNIEHIALAEKADLVLVAPATANIIGKVAGGICDDLLSCMVCATKAPVLFCPAMNEGMFTNKFVQENIKKLKNAGYKFVQPRKGELACGKFGLGCLAEVD
ncbi:MAG: bifunctional 4'-phosphopantothenoylcysteine decarboxylase/phosphopantothenoylcysteine synthetase, partial [Candidatus Omnitrophica bacterium]|nr:bifunctional 4'-phosphopantothenoylcysteine decarboxylase/phosphopantothenoylcysteine synthetase [Candidatus Omnitrophota bacterium]